jgi:rRNA biogenesis protein RRP5
MYDSLLHTYKNRTDLWSVYIDMLVKHNRLSDTRDVFNRIICLNLNPKKMKFIFKKYMDFEKAHGTEDLVLKVKEMALKYIDNKTEVMKMALTNDKENSMDVEEMDFS